MSEPDPRPGSAPEGPADSNHARTLLIFGALAFLAVFLSEDGRRIFPNIFQSFANGDFPTGEDAVAVSGLLMLAVIALASPFLLRWLELSRLLTRLLLVCSALLATCFWFFTLRYFAYGAVVLLPLALSPTLTFFGLRFVQHPDPGEPFAH